QLRELPLQRAVKPHAAVLGRDDDFDAPSGQFHRLRHLNGHGSPWGPKLTLTPASCAVHSNPLQLCPYRHSFTWLERVAHLRLEKVIYMLNELQKKSRRGIATPKTELELIEQRLKRAREDYQQWSRNEIPKSR